MSAVCPGSQHGVGGVGIVSAGAAARRHLHLPVTTGQLFLLVAAGFGAGLSGSMAGLASLFSYPALLAVGLPPATANMTNTVALLASTVGSVAGSRPELVGQGPRVRQLAPLVVLGGAVGATILFLTPAGGFEKIVPFLVGAASVILLLQPLIRAAARGSDAGTTGSGETRLGGPEGGPTRRAPLLVLAGIFGVGIYGGYFGAAAGVLLLALLLIGMPVSLLQANGLKNVLIGLANATAAVAFMVFGDVRWLAVLPLAAGVLVGSWIGPAIARRVPTTLLRITIALAGIGLAIKLGIDAF